MVTLAMRTTAVLLGYFKFKITKTLRRAQKFGDSGPYKNFDFFFNPPMHDFFSRNLVSLKKDAMD